jgi:geranylgeranyl pyrophosphate synthase
MDAITETKTLRASGLIPEGLANKADRSDYYFRPDEWVSGLVSRVEDLLRAELNSSDALTSEIGRHMLFGYAKRLRPIFVMLSQHMISGETSQIAIDCAASSELVHCASLFHDDVIDNAKTRKGLKAANSIWGNRSAVIVGDQFFVLAYKLLTRHRDFRIIELFVDMCRLLAEGVMLEIRHTGDLELSEEQYLEIISKKTAMFFSYASLIGGYIGGADPELEAELAEFGLNFGLAFQVSDDLLDIFADPDATGKPRGSDIRSGIYTCPVIYALKESREFSERYQSILESGNLTASQIDEIAIELEAAGAKKYAQDMVQSFGEKALSHLDNLPSGPASDSLRDLLGKITNREF